MKHGWRSGLEEQISAELTELGVEHAYEAVRLGYLVPERAAKYTPDFALPNGIYIETKGRFLTADRKKHLLVKDSHPTIDIRFIFTNPQTRISKQSKTTYADWCDKHGFKWCKAVTKAQRKKGALSIPKEWL